ncbi:hypothetical protein CYLTODRAFT_233800 [Cylindrobasidium torrendii FP15055 ss-10]|uniref:Zn(2)-C6 fungal-type domain-containing protein n=1 Tax=Cylindrobasidium torrendii FP15055 ss-10 TaxID=1314674 RepID=A0A0D7BGL2_9AGAR|nr:hypothetical protein CYLTODRAFT_233800 [Cylindrobasidium torrendii FP15055 ss-10]
MGSETKAVSEGKGHRGPPRGPRTKTCDSCRNKKQACDRKRPCCGQCKKGQVACVYSDQKNIIAQLNDTVNELEARLRQQEIRRLMGAALQPRTAVHINNLEFNVAESRAFCIRHRTRLALCFSPARLAALEAGDLSVVDPRLLYAGRLVASILESGRRDIDPSLRPTLQSIDTQFDNEDPTTALQMSQMLSKFAHYTFDMSGAREHILKAYHIAVKWNRNMIPSSQSPDMNPRWEEDLGVFAQLLYTDQARHLEPDTPRILPDYLYDELEMIPPLYPLLGMDSYVLAVQAVAMLRFRQAYALAEKWEAGSCCLHSSDRRCEARADLLRKITTELAYLKTRMEQARNAPHCREVIHALLGPLFRLLGASLKIHAVSATVDTQEWGELVNAALKIAGMTRTLREEDLYLLCPVTMYVWAQCSAILKDEMRRNLSGRDIGDIESALDVFKRNAIAMHKELPGFRLIGHMEPYIS